MMNMLKMCLNPKVLVGLAAVGVGVYLVAPDLALAALPFLVLALCPVSMLMMMWAMRRSQDGAQRTSQKTGTGRTREEQISCLQAHKVGLTDRIAETEQEQPQPAKDGKGR